MYAATRKRLTAGLDGFGANPHGGWVLLPVCAAVVLLASPAQAWLDLDGCPELDGPALRDLTRLEIGEHPPHVRARIECRPEAFVVTVTSSKGPSSERRIARTAATGEVPERYLALELTELIEASSHAAAQPDPSPQDPKPDGELTTPQAPRRRRGFVSAGARAEIGGQPAMAAGGGQVSLGGRVWQHLTLRTDIVAVGGARRVRGDGVRSGSLWLAGVALATFDVGRNQLGAGAGARVGGVWIRGIPEAGSTLQGRLHAGLSWSPQLSVAFSRAVGRAAFFGVGTDAGWLVRPVRGFSNAALVYAATGPWASVSISVGGWFGR